MAGKRSVMTLFSDPQAMHSHRVRVVMAEKNVTVDMIDASPDDLPEDVIDLNPYGTLPTLVDRELVLYEARIVMEYLDERFPHPPLLPVDPVSRASTRLYLHRVEKDWLSLADRIEQGGKGTAEARRALAGSLMASAPIFAAKPYFMNDEFSMIDASIAPLMWRLPKLGVELKGDGAKHIHAYSLRLFKRQGFGRSLSEVEREMRA